MRALVIGAYIMGPWINNCISSKNLAPCLELAAASAAAPYAWRAGWGDIISKHQAYSALIMSEHIIIIARCLGIVTASHDGGLSYILQRGHHLLMYRKQQLKGLMGQ